MRALFTVTLFSFLFSTAIAQNSGTGHPIKINSVSIESGLNMASPNQLVLQDYSTLKRPAFSFGVFTSQTIMYKTTFVKTGFESLLCTTPIKNGANRFFYSEASFIFPFSFGNVLQTKTKNGKQISFIQDFGPYVAFSLEPTISEKAWSRQYIYNDQNNMFMKVGFVYNLQYSSVNEHFKGQVMGIRVHIDMLPVYSTNTSFSSLPMFITFSGYYNISNKLKN